MVVGNSVLRKMFGPMKEGLQVTGESCVRWRIGDYYFLPNIMRVVK